MNTTTTNDDWGLPEAAAAEETTGYTAWVTTRDSMPQAWPGIEITSWTEVDGYREDRAERQPVATSLGQDLPDDWGQADDGGLDENQADAELERLGYRRIEDWDEFGNGPSDPRSWLIRGTPQGWVTTVEPIED